jgi:hypothetical protein
MADEKFTVVFRRAPDYRIYPSNIVYGGPTPDSKNILLNVCVDHQAFPSYTQHKVEAGRVNMGEPGEQVTAGQVEREMVAGVLMSLDQARSLHGMLGRVIQSMEKRNE